MCLIKKYHQKCLIFKERPLRFWFSRYETVFEKKNSRQENKRAEKQGDNEGEI